MEPEYWIQRWQEGRTGRHHDKLMPLLMEHWPALEVPPGTRVLVPLCQKHRSGYIFAATYTIGRSSPCSLAHAIASG
jgi:thiopurine S-methyltransferase